MKKENIKRIEQELFKQGYTVHEYYKSYGIASYYLFSNVYYAITSLSGRVLYSPFSTKQGAKMFITKMINKGVL